METVLNTKFLPEGCFRYYFLPRGCFGHYFSTWRLFYTSFQPGGYFWHEFLPGGCFAHYFLPNGCFRIIFLPECCLGGQFSYLEPKGDGEEANDDVSQGQISWQIKNVKYKCQNFNISQHNNRKTVIFYTYISKGLLNIKLS